MPVHLDRLRWYWQRFGRGFSIDSGLSGLVPLRIYNPNKWYLGVTPISWLLLLVLSGRRCRWVWAASHHALVFRGFVLGSEVLVLMSHPLLH